MYFTGACSVSQKPLGERKNACPSLFICSLAILKITGRPRRPPTRAATCLLSDRRTSCRCPLTGPSRLIDGRNGSVVPLFSGRFRSAMLKNLLILIFRSLFMITTRNSCHVLSVGCTCVHQTYRVRSEEHTSELQSRENL